MIQTWLWTGVIGMALGVIFFGFGAHNAKNEQWKILYTLNFFICLIAAGLYLAMALKQGVNIINDRPTYWVRYVTWFLSTPLLLLDLTFLGRTSLPITGSLLGANAYMIATGFVATISPKPISYIWYIVSCAAYVAVAYMLLNQYPVVWILGTEGFNVFAQGAETMFFTLLDLASKVGFGFLSLNTLHNIEPARDQRREPINTSV